MTLLCSSQMDFGIGPPRLRSIRGEILVRQSVAGGSAGLSADCTLALSAVVGDLRRGLSDLVVSSRGGKAIASFHPMSHGGSAKLRSAGSLKSRATASRRHELSRLHRSVHTPLKVSRCVVLTQSHNSENKLQLSEKSFRRSEIAIARIQGCRATGQGVEQ
ncbi:hypothetical protein [Bradyrhizobium sp. 192]|uniref:hypothetical protein n=1 Tax=Bradyrhizobium sp. 192 TaxID=2782660 RepID=UPI001FFE8DA8|nr:hypothetical protein [Bradyrhizobium sp. 192]UPJ60303.1 hypothetical protein IVB24_12090 [Bradyrhizobium sp. 192]